MKVRVPKVNSKSLEQIIDSGITLSIGMIVKNEHKHIRNCLEALQPLRDAVSCELIIADTGSTDDTFDICKEFTEQVYHFEWVNDFAAARNSTIARAKGMWYMFIDADEYLDKDISAMVQFFSDPVNKYLCATYIIKNYDYASWLTTNFPAPRIARNLPSLKFIGRIHECLDVPNEFYNLPTIAHHYGYVYQTQEDRDIKWKRNRDLMLKELEATPNDVRLLTHLADVSDPDEREKYLLKALDILHKEDYAKLDLKKDIYTQNQMYRCKVYISLCVHFSGDNNDFETSYKYAKEYFTINEYKNTCGAIDMYVLLGEACSHTKRWEESFTAYENYFKVYEKLQKGTLNNFDKPIMSFFNDTPLMYLNNKSHYITALGQGGQYDKSHEQLESIDINLIALSSYNDFCLGINSIMESSKRFDRYVNIYRNVQKTNDSYRLETFIDIMESYYRKNPSDREQFVNKIADTNATDIPFVRLMQLLKKDKSGENVAEDLQEYFSSLKEIKTGQTEAVYLALKHKVYFSNLYKTANYNRVQLIFTDLLSIHGAEYINFVTEYCEYEKFTNNISEIFWAVTMMYFATKKSENLPYNLKLEVYDKFSNFLADFVYNVYNPDLLNKDDVEILPPLYRFGFYIGKAKSSLENGDKIGYIRALKDGLSLCEEMKDLVTIFIKEFEKSMRSAS
ncbi:glycosyl transferase [Clostridia bacterium]|nr:glycosyl transferase [Clostridia bacterium]